MKSGDEDLFSHLILEFSSGDPKGGVGGVACTSLHRKQKGEQCQTICSKACSRDWGGPADKNPAQKTGPLPLEQKFQCLAGNQKACDLCVEKRFRGEDKAEHAQGRCRGVGGNMTKVDTKGGARVQAVSFTGRKKVVVTKREKERDGTVRASNPRPS